MSWSTYFHALCASELSLPPWVQPLTLDLPSLHAQHNLPTHSPHWSNFLCDSSNCFYVHSQLPSPHHSSSSSNLHLIDVLGIWNSLEKLTTIAIDFNLLTGLVSSGDSLTSWGEGASLALVGNPSSDGITIKMPYGVDVLHRPASHPIFSYWVG